MKPETGEWVQKAEGDFQVAGREMQASMPVYDAVCFHAQQCVEKYMKALLVERDIPFPKTHDLIVLLDLCVGVMPELTSQRPQMASLGAYAVAFRYPGEAAIAQDAEEAQKIMNVVRSFLRCRLGLQK